MSPQVEFDEFTNWWINGVMHPPKGSNVFRMLSDKLEGKCKNVRYAANSHVIFCAAWSFVHTRP